MLHRLTLLVACLLAVLAFAAAPAFAGKEDDDDNGADGGADGAAPEAGVATGAGGTADQGPSALELGLGSAAVVLTIAAGGFVLRRRLAGEPS